MKRFFFILLAATLIFSCKADTSEIEARLDTLENVSIASLQAQLTQMSTTLEALQGTQAQLSGYVTSLQTSVGTLQGNYSSLQSAVNELQQKDQTFESNLQELQDAIGDSANDVKRWVESSYATLQQFTQVQTDITGIKTDIQSIFSRLDGLDQTTQTIANNLRDATADLTGKLGKCQEDIAGILEDLEALQGDMDTVKEQIAAIISAVQSVVVVPDYTDGSVKMTDKAENVIRFEVYPLEAAENLATLGVSALSLDYVETETKSDALTNIPLTAVSFDGEFLRVTADGTSLKDEITAGTASANARLRISDGTVVKSSEYFLLNIVEPTPSEEVVSKGAYKHVVIIGADGAGAFFKDTDTPRCDEIFTGQATTYTCRVGMPSMSAQGWGSILHGVLPEYHGLTNDIIKNTPYPESSPYPSIFKVVRNAMPDAVLASFVEWNPINVGIVEDGLGVEKGTGADDAEVTSSILSYLTDNTPTLMFVQFSSPDDIGETYGFGSDIYLSTISTVDALIGSIYDKLKAKDLLDDTLFMVTADHGGINKGHGGGTDVERNVFLGVSGKTVADDTIVEAEARDVAAIAAYALGIESPYTWTGRVPAGVFKDVKEAAPHRDPGDEYRGHETVPTPALSEIQALLAGHNVVAYLPFDGNINDAFGNVTTTPSGTLTYSDAYFGKGVKLNEGYVTLNNVKVSTNSFSVAFWLKGTTLDNQEADPSLISNKDWEEGKYKGFILSYRGSRDLKFNVGKGSSDNKYRMDYVRYLPDNFDTGWMHVVLTVDRPNRKVHIYIDFIPDGEGGELQTFFDNVSFDSMNLNIGQDGTGVLQYSLPAEMDEFIMTSDVLSAEDVAALRTYYER